MDESAQLKPLAVVTGASSGIGYALAKEFAEHGFDLLICAEHPAELNEAAHSLSQAGARVETCAADLSTPDGVESLCRQARELDRPVDALAANAGVGLGGAFIDQDLNAIFRVINTNVTGTVHLIRRIAKDMADRGQGRILITSSIAALMPGAFNAIYNASKAFLQSFAFALRNELKDAGVTVTSLMPGATETEFFERAGLEDTKIGQSERKDDPADVAKTGFQALMKGEGDVVHGLRNKLQAAAAAVMPESALAEMHRGMAEPETAQK